MAALILYVPANLLPIVLVDYQGRHLEITIVDGIRDLFGNGHFFLGVLVLTTSFLTPVMKILGLLFLAFAPAGLWMLGWRRRIYDLIRMVNPWNAMEVFLLATLFTLVNFGALATVRAGDGAPAFTAVVLLTAASTVVFQPSALWRRPGMAGQNEAART